jgi:hypothetical protein
MHGRVHAHAQFARRQPLRGKGKGGKAVREPPAHKQKDG